MKRRETKSGREGAGRRTAGARAARTLTPYEDRLSGVMPDPKRMSASCRSALARTGSRWLSFARTFSRGRGRLAVADTLAFVESLYGGKFKAAEGGAFSWDKVYRTSGGGLFVSETRLSVSMRPRFDLHLLSLAAGRAGSEALKKEAQPKAAAAHILLSRARAGDREQPRGARQSANMDSRSFQSFSTALYQTISPVTFTLLRRQTHLGGLQTTTLLQARSAHVGAAPSFMSLTVASFAAASFAVRSSSVLSSSSLSSSHTWNVLPAGSEKLPPAFGYVSARGRREQQAQGFESARPLVRVERLTHGGAAASPTPSPNAETSRRADAPSHMSLGLTSLNLLRPAIPAPRQEFASVLLKTSVAVTDSREVLGVMKARDFSGAASPRSVARDVAERRFAPAHGAAEPQSPVRTYASPKTRQQPGGAVEIRREFRSTETVREHATARHARPHILQMLSPASLLPRLSEAYLPALMRGAEGAGRNTHDLGGRAPALSLLHLGTYTAASSASAREGSADAHAPRPFNPAPLFETPPYQTAPPRATVTREVLSSLNTFVERVYSTFAVTQALAGHAHADRSTAFVRPAFESALRRGLERASARQPGDSGVAVPGRESSGAIFVRAFEVVRPAPVAEFRREAPARGGGAQFSPERAPGVYWTRGVSTREAFGVGTFLFASGLLRRSGGASTAGGLTQTTAAAMRLAAAGEAAREARELREARAARPEGMALELIRQRREDVLRLPQPGYVFTQPSRAQLEERQVVSRASREEIVEVVRKEVRTLAASAPAQNAAARADLAGIADEVYSTLVRRLLVEKERLGRA